MVISIIVILGIITLVMVATEMENNIDIGLLEVAFALAGLWVVWCIVKIWITRYWHPHDPHWRKKADNDAGGLH